MRDLPGVVADIVNETEFTRIVLNKLDKFIRESGAPLPLTYYKIHERFENIVVKDFVIDDVMDGENGQ